MDIAIVAPSSVPFCIGGAENFGWGLHNYINQETRHRAELIKLPSREHTFWDLVASYRSFSQLDLSHFDLVISSKYPAWMVRHPRHICYMLHRLRGLYDTYYLHGLPTECDAHSPFAAAVLKHVRKNERSPDSLEEAFELLDKAHSFDRDAPEFASFPSPMAKAVVRYFDGIGLAPSRIFKYGAISRTVAERTEYFPVGAPITIAYPPSNLSGLRQGKQDHFFTVGRFDGAKRIDLLVQAFRQANTRLPFKIAGTGPLQDSIKELADGDGRVELLGFANDSEIVDLYADSLAVLYTPWQEDYGLVTIEAMMSGKPVITAADSGGPLEFVEHGVNGLVATPEPVSLAAGIDRLAASPDGTLAMGAAGKARVNGISWRNAVSALLDEFPASYSSRQKPKPKITLAATFPIYPPRGGGQSRIFYLYREVAKFFHVDLVTFTGSGEKAATMDIAPGMREVRIPKSQEHERDELRLSAKMSHVPVTDVVMPRLFCRTPEYLAALSRSAATAEILIASHPYLLPALDQVRRNQTLVFEAQDIEADLKASILPPTRIGRYFLRLTQNIEQECCQRSALTFACSEADRLELIARYGARPQDTIVVPNGVDIDSIPFTSWENRIRRRSATAPYLALFIGSWHGPNIEAAFFVMEIARSLPGIRFVILGGVGEYLRHFEYAVPDNVEVLGIVEEQAKNEFLASADLALNPTENGSGTNLKMLDYMAAGLPVLTTPFGSRGLDVTDGHEVFVSELIDFPQRIVQIQQETPTRLTEVTHQGRAHVEEMFSWEAIGKQLVTTLRELTTGISATSPNH